MITAKAKSPVRVEVIVRAVLRKIPISPLLAASRRKALFPLAAIVIFTLPLLSGCAVRRVRSDYNGFEKAFADTSNRELLLNLARLQNHDPTYFFKMGQITSAYRMAANVTSSAGYASQSSISGKSNTTGSGGPGASYENDPTFQFIPVNDETNAQLLLKPVPAETFYILYTEGWRIDQLIRLMVDRVEVTSSSPTGCSITTYRNAPPTLEQPSGTGKDWTPADPEQLSRYVSFLRIAALAYGLQRHGLLLLRGVPQFVPLDVDSIPTGPSSAGGGGGGGGNNSGSGAASNNGGQNATNGGANAAGAPSPPAQKASGETDPTKIVIDAGDIEKAAEKNLSYEVQGNAVLIGQKQVVQKFYLLPPKPSTGAYEPNDAEIEKEIKTDPSLQVLAQGDVLANFINALRDGLTIEGDSTPQKVADNPCPQGQASTSTHLVLRSLIGVMAAAAQEQDSFDKLVASNELLQKQPGDATALSFKEAIPGIELTPILRINYQGEYQPDLGARTPALTELKYQDMTYSIADPKKPAVPENQYWNHDVFRLIAALTAQVTVDVSKYPIANILQLNTQ